MTVYMAVTADDKQLPLYVADTAKDMAHWAGRSKSTVLSEACRNAKRAKTEELRPLKGGRKYPYCIVRVVI